MHPRNYATISDEHGNPLLSYKGRSGVILSPSTIEWQLLPSIAQALGADENAPLGLGSGHDMVTTMPEEHLFHQDIPVELLVGVRTGPNSSSYVEADGAKRIRFHWHGVGDYRDVNP
jgi:hypothetical protein